MPTERFLHLSESKKALIREAAIKEFSRVPIEKVSINKIVQNADISRGSFYTYFEDKEDLLGYIFEEFVNQVKDFCRQCLDNNNGDFWALLSGMMEYLLQVCREKRMFVLAQTASGHEVLIKFMGNRDSGHDGMCAEEFAIQELYERTNCENLRVDGPEDFQQLFSIGIHTMLAAIADVYKKGKDEEEANDINNKLMCKNINIKNILDSDTEYSGGICIITSYLAKGLEFDGVIISNASMDKYDDNKNIDMKLLYVAMTRPLHELKVLYKNNIVSPLLKEAEL